MRLRENPVFGRKVFFINPPFMIEKKISELLKEQEYEVYLIKNYQEAKGVLRYFENAMCFINIDDDLSLKGWYNFIKSFDEDSQLKTIFVGILATKTPEASIQKFIINLRLPGGYVPLNLPQEEVLKRLDGILEINGAKGERKYLSLTCNNVEALTGYIAYGSKLYSMSFENISSIGITCCLPNDLAQILKKNTVLDNVSLSLGRWSVITKCVVLSVNTFNDKVIAILLFTRDVPEEVRSSIRKFIYEVLNKQLYEIIQRTPADSINYSNYISNSGNEIPDYDAPTENEKNSSESKSEGNEDNKEEAESLEEIDEAVEEKTDEVTSKEETSDESASDSEKKSETTENSEKFEEKSETKLESETSENPESTDKESSDSK